MKIKSKEPEFMKELHLIRARLSKKWEKMSDREFFAHLHKTTEKFKQSLHLRKNELALHS